MFGHERGAFTGAVAQKKGKLEVAEGGTVFLDEIGELAASLQAKLLRVLQERTFERVGGTQTYPLDIRLVAATNRNLATGSESRAGSGWICFDRLNVIALKAPPLRERKEDIPLLAAHFISLAGARCRRRLEGATDEFVDCLMRIPWPGNIRELQNAIERAVILGVVVRMAAGGGSAGDGAGGSAGGHCGIEISPSDQCAKEADDRGIGRVQPRNDHGSSQAPRRASELPPPLNPQPGSSGASVPRVAKGQRAIGTPW